MEQEIIFDDRAADAAAPRIGLGSRPLLLVCAHAISSLHIEFYGLLIFSFMLDMAPTKPICAMLFGRARAHCRAAVHATRRSASIPHRRPAASCLRLACTWTPFGWRREITRKLHCCTHADTQMLFHAAQHTNHGPRWRGWKARNGTN